MTRYKTIIEIISEAENTSEAADIAGDYLQGQLDSGISMRCSTKAIKSPIPLKIFALGLILIGTLSYASYLEIKEDGMKSKSLSLVPVSACQPPLKTMMSAKEFTDEWQGEKTKTALDFAKR